MKKQGPPSWLGTLIVAVAAAAMTIWAAARLRRSVHPAPLPAPAHSAVPVGR